MFAAAASGASIGPCARGPAARSLHGAAAAMRGPARALRASAPDASLGPLGRARPRHARTPRCSRRRRGVARPSVTAALASLKRSGAITEARTRQYYAAYAAAKAR